MGTRTKEILIINYDEDGVEQWRDVREVPVDFVPELVDADGVMRVCVPEEVLH